MANADLPMHEAVLLLALRDDAGTPPLGAPVQAAMGAGMVAELLLRGRVAAEKARFSTLLVMRSAQQTGDPLLDALLERIRSARRRASVATWLARAGGTRKLQKSVARRLCQRGIVRADEKQILLFFTRTVYPQVDPVPQQRMVDRMRAAVLADGAVDAYTATLLGIARRASLLPALLDKAERKSARKRIDAVVAMHPEAKLIDDAIKAALESAAAAATVTTM